MNLKRHHLAFPILAIAGIAVLSSCKNDDDAGGSGRSSSANSASQERPYLKVVSKSVDETGFDDDDIKAMFISAEQSWQKLDWTDRNKHQQTGMFVNLPAQEAELVRERLAEKLSPDGYRFAVIERLTPMHSKEQLYKVAVIQTDDDTEFLEVGRTDLGNDEKPTQLADHLSGWSSENPFTVVAAGADFLRIEFTGKDPDYDEIAADVFTWLPDLATEKWEKPETLASEMARCNCLTLDAGE